MARQIQFRRGTTAQHSTFTGAAGEVTVDTDKDVVVVHDGSTVGGFPVTRQLSDLDITATATELNYVDGVTSNIQTQLDAKGTVSSLSDLGITATDTELNYVDGVTSAIQTQLDGKLNKSGDTMTGDLILNADPTTALGAATKEYVDTIAAAGIHYHTAVRVESPANLNATYDNGTSGVGATLTNAGTQAAISIDGVALILNDRVLVYNQTNAAHNGVYTVTTVGDGASNWVLTRATDADSYGASDPDSLGEGDAFFVKEGDTGAGELYVMNTSGAITFGTTDITFSVIAETAVYTAGTDLTLDGTVFNLNSTIAADTTGNAATATAWETARTITLSGDVTGTATGVDGSGNISITTTVASPYTDSDVDTHLNTGTATSGEYLSWNGTDYDWATVPAGYTDADVDTHLNTGTALNGQYLSWNGTDYDWLPLAAPNDATITLTAGTALSGGGDFTTDQSGNETITFNFSGGIDDLSDGYFAGNSVGLGSGALGNDDGSANNNTAIGYEAGYGVTTGFDNFFGGYQAGKAVTTGNNNVVTGYRSGTQLTTGASNVISGAFAGFGLSTGSNNVLLGRSASFNKTSGDNTIVIGYNAQGSTTTVSNEITVGNTSISRFRIPGAGIDNTSTSLSGTSVSVDVGARDTYTHTLTGSTTYTFTGEPSSGQVGTITLIITGNGSTITWDSAVDWAGGTAPDAPASGETDVFTFQTINGGTTWYGFHAGDAMA